MLGFIQDYINPATYPWQIPFLLAFFAGWLFGGARLLKRNILRIAPQPKLKFRRCVLTMFVSVVAGMVLGGACLAVVYVIGKRIEQDVRLLSGVVGVVVGVTASFVGVYAMVNAPMRKAFKIGLLPLGATFALGGIVAVTCIVPALGARKQVRDFTLCYENVGKIAKAIKKYQSHTHGQPPPSLSRLAEDPRAQAIMDPEDLACPATHSQTIAYFYLPTRPAEEGTQKMLLCDFAGHHPLGRTVIFADPRPDRGVRMVMEKEFQTLLQLKVNEDFARELAAVEKRPREALPVIERFRVPTSAPAGSQPATRP